jgi:hypothetical protein
LFRGSGRTRGLQASERATLIVALMLASVVGTLVGCAHEADVTARFLRYVTLQDGTRAAVISPVASGAQPEEQRAYTGMADLKPGEIVLVRWVGRSWETPQWRPEREIVPRGNAP